MTPAATAPRMPARYRGAVLGAFEFFFSFYGLLLGFSVAELVGGFARLIHDRKAVRFGLLTPLLAVFVAIDITTFWNQAWVIMRFAPFNFALLVLALFVASVFYIAATLVFPREVGGEGSMDEHFWRHRRMVLLCVLAANTIMATLFLTVTAATGELAALHLPAAFWIGLALFSTMTLVAAFARGRRVVIAALVILLIYQGYVVGRSAASLIQQGGWSVREAPAESTS